MAKLQEKVRMWQSIFVAIVCLGALYFIAPQQLGILLLKTTYISMGLAIGLPSNLFPTTSIPVAILIFDRSREKGGVNQDNKNVLFIDASQDYQPGGNQNTLMDEHMEKILNAYKNRKSQEKYAHLASYDELKENDFNLNIPRYVDTF